VVRDAGGVVPVGIDHPARATRRQVGTCDPRFVAGPPSAAPLPGVDARRDVTAADPLPGRCGARISMVV
jgi:hypothetical protein